MAEWHELVIDGTEKSLHAFVVGFVAGAGGHVRGVFGRDLPLEHDSLGERLKELLRAGSHHVFLAPAALADPLARALQDHGATVGLWLERRRVIREGSMGFRVETFSREEAGRIRALLLESLPAGVRVEKSSETEEIHPESRGPEPFAPLHAYTYRVAGRIVGTLEGVWEVWERVRERDFIDIGTLSLHEDTT